MFNRRPKYDVVEKFRAFRNLFDKLYIILAGISWIISTIWDIYNLQRFWLDYMAEFYGCFFLFNMMVFSINPKLLPVKIYNSFSLVTTIRGRATLLIIISSLFLNDYHKFHQFCAILLLIGGILYIVCEILVPTTREELEQIESYYNNINNNKNINNNSGNINNNNTNSNNSINNLEDNIQVTIDNNNNVNIETNKSISMMEKSDAIMNEGQNEVDFKRDLNENFDNANNNKTFNETNNEKIENNNKNGLIEEEIIRKTDNPYELPEDF